MALSTKTNMAGAVSPDEVLYSLNLLFISGIKCGISFTGADSVELLYSCVWDAFLYG